MNQRFLCVQVGTGQHTDQLLGELCDGSVPAPQLLSELLHLLQKSLYLRTNIQTGDD